MANDLRKKLEDQFNNIQTKNKDLQTQKLIDDSILDKKRSDVIQELFSVMKEAGVDMTDIASIRGFLDKLYRQNPDMAKLFEIAFNNITGGEAGVPDIQQVPDGQVPGGQAPGGQVLGGQVPGGQIPGGQIAPPPQSPPSVQENTPNLMDKYKNLGQQMLG